MVSWIGNLGERDVRAVWTEMYESNPRRNSYNKKILKVVLGSKAKRW